MSQQHTPSTPRKCSNPSHISGQDMSATPLIHRSSALIRNQARNTSTPQKGPSLKAEMVYYDGVPGAPIRKLRTDGREQDRKATKAKVKSVAQLLDFGLVQDEVNGPVDSMQKTDFPPLGSPVHLAHKGGEERAKADSAMKRCLSSTDSDESVMKVKASRSSTFSPALPTGQAMRRTVSTSSKFPTSPLVFNLRSIGRKAGKALGPPSYDSFFTRSPRSAMA